MLATLVRDLPASWRNGLSAIYLSADDGLHWRATLTYALWVPAQRLSEVGPYAISVDTQDLPPGITASGWTRVPDTTHEMGTATSAEVERAIRELDHAGLVGRLDAARMESGAWIVKTHAGSDEERRAWLLAISTTTTQRS